MTSRILSTKVLKRNAPTSRNVGLVRGKRSRKASTKAGNEPTEVRGKPVRGTPIPPPEPVELTFRDMVHDAISGLEAARRAFDNLRVQEFRGRHDLAKLEDVSFHEELERVMGWLIRLDLEMPEVTP